MYLASMPGLRDEVKRSPDITSALLRRICSADLAHMRMGLQDQQHADFMSAALIALARLASGDETLQERLAAGEGGGKAGGGGQDGALLARLGKVFESGVPSWQAAAGVLLYTLAGEQLRRPAVMSWVAARVDPLLDLGMSLIETGAYMNSTDAVSAGAQLLELATALPAGRERAIEGGAAPVLSQVVITYAGVNGTSDAIGHVARVMQQLVDARTQASGKSAVPQQLLSAGVIAPLVQDVRLGQNASLAPALSLLLAVMRADEGGDASREAVGTGLLSICAQLLFKEQSNNQARSQCSAIVKHFRLLVSKEAAPAYRAPSTTAEDTVGTVTEDEAPPTYKATSDVSGAYDDTSAGREALAADLLRMMRETQLPDLHNAALEACRDVAVARAAAEALMAAGAVPQMAHILSHKDAAASGEEKDVDASGHAWLLQSQRSAAALVALLALQGPLRERVVDEGALQGLAAALAMHSGQPGLMAQVRITAAAALVPLLGEDGRYNAIAVAAGVLEPLVKMYYSRSEQERQVASRVMKVLGKDSAVAEMYARVGIKVM